VVAINSDTSARHLKGPGRPIVPERDRAEVLAALECVDYVTVFRETTPARLIGAISPNVLAKGADWKIGKIVGRDIVRATGGRIVRIPLAKGRSTTSIVERILGRRPPRSRLK
jgi:rfaE bifunctional protein nucleotidyltransferase chain/domain